MVLLFLLLSVALLAKADGDVACTGTGLNWYINMVGESPCTTYERLRQICNPSYQVGTMNVNTPPDACDEQVADCCCNSVAFTLSMLCLNCQQGGSGNGIDAGKGAYQLYLQGSRSPGQWCSPVTNTSLPDNIDTAVCDRNIKIIDDIRTGLFWSDGSWFYMWSYEAISKDVGANNNNAFTHCTSTTSTSTTSTSTSSSATSTSVSGSTATAAVQAVDTTEIPLSPNSASSSTTPASVTSSAGSASIPASGSTIILEKTFSVIYSSSNSYFGSPPLSTSISGDANGTTPGGTNGSNQTFSAPSYHMGKGLIGVIVGAAIGIVCALLALWFFCRSLRKRKGASRTITPTPANVEPFVDREPSWYTAGSNSGNFTPRPRKLELENRSDSRIQPQLTSVYYNDLETDDQRDSSYGLYSDAIASDTLLPVRHVDAGPARVVVERRMSGSLPPAYGEQIL
ncbi:hypothetical protein F5876DRAFT_75291 [Lentinula aff. lateritia]|uniref:Uncharacterized protein n=1 Tax=Lentinula aff. lateritia TaxID=2804960 RepID=A0ACC1U599_9AGAR|nr:hypothetical protein F5876DRAFT_75291 [Lentinula aff. lateritia]